LAKTNPLLYILSHGEEFQQPRQEEFYPLLVAVRERRKRGRKEGRERKKNKIE